MVDPDSFYYPLKITLKLALILGMILSCERRILFWNRIASCCFYKFYFYIYYVIIYVHDWDYISVQASRTPDLVLVLPGVPGGGGARGGVKNPGWGGLKRGSELPGFLYDDGFVRGTENDPPGGGISLNIPPFRGGVSPPLKSSSVREYTASKALASTR